MHSGNVEFIGQSPQQSQLLSSTVDLPPSMTREGGRMSGYGPAARGTHGVRTAADSAVAAEDALKMLKDGNDRFAVGAPLAKHATAKMREALVSHGQAPHAAVFGCADSRVPVDTIFDAMPGDLFVLRNAGNTCTHAEGSMVGSLEFCCGKLGSKLILVLGHTQCGAIAGATKTYLTSKGGNSTKNAGCALEGLLIGLSRVAEQAEEELGVGARLDHLVAHSVKVNVFHSIDFLLKFSEPLRKLVKSGTLLIKLHFTFYFLFVAFVLFFDIMEDIEVCHFSPVKPLCRKPGNPGWHLPHGNGSCGVSRVFSEAGGVVGF